MGEWTIGAVLDAIADVVPDRLMTVCGNRQSTFAESADRTRRLANFLAHNGFGAHQERDALRNWECGQDRVALVMHNDLYVDVAVGCLKARTVPVNVNYNYTSREVRELLEYIKPRAIVYHRQFGAKLADALPESAELLIAVDDGSASAELPESIGLDEALARGDADQAITPSPDDVMMICTGGTTGRPRGVMWRQCDTYVVSMSGADHESAAEIHQKVTTAGPPWLALSPLMHAAGMWTAFSAVLNGQTVVLYGSTKFDARTALQLAEREKVGMMTMVGDAYAAPLVEELGRHPYDLSTLFAIGTGGAATNPKHQRALLKYLPQLTIINGYGSSETGNVGFGHSQIDTQRDTFEMRDGALVTSEDRTRFLEPGEPESGWVVRAGRIPLGYFDDAVATEKTFPEIGAKRVVVSGDRGTLAEDGTLRLHGRDSLVVNTGGEKVFVEEVEEVLRAHPGVVDALVVGRPSERWGQEVVALVALKGDAHLTNVLLHDHCTSSLARFKAPKEFIVVEQIRRLGNGKADYRWAGSRVLQPDASSPTATPRTT